MWVKQGISRTERRSRRKRTEYRRREGRSVRCTDVTKVGKRPSVMTVNVSSSSTLSEKTPNQRCVQFRGCVKVRCKSTFSVPIRNPESVEFNKKGLYTTVDCRRSKLIELNEFIERGSNSRNRSHYIKVEPQTSELTFCVLVTEVH